MNKPILYIMLPFQPFSPLMQLDNYLGKWLLCLLSVWFFVLNLFGQAAESKEGAAQEVVIVFQYTDSMTQHFLVDLYRVELTNAVFVDSLTVPGIGWYLLKDPAGSTGLYRLTVQDEYHIDLLATAGDTTFVQFDDEALFDNEILISLHPERQAVAAFFQLYDSIETRQALLEAELKQQCEQPRSEVCATAIRNWRTFLESRNAFPLEFKQHFGGTYANCVLAPLFRVAPCSNCASVKDYLLYQKKLYLSRESFACPILFRHYYMAEVLNKLLENAAKENETYLQTAIDTVLDRIALQPPAAQVLFLQNIAGVLVRMKNETGLRKMLQIFGPGWTQSLNEDLLADVGALIDVVGVGKTIPNAQLVNAKSAQVQLTPALQEKPLNLLLIWETNCPECENRYDEAAKLIEEYGALGLGLVNISMDIDTRQWQTGLESKPIGLNLCAGSPENSQHLFDLWQMSHLPGNMLVAGKSGKIIAGLDVPFSAYPEIIESWLLENQ